MNAEFSDIQYNGVMSYPRGYRRKAPERPHFFQEEILAEVSKYPPCERRRILRQIKDAIAEGKAWR